MAFGCWPESCDDSPSQESAVPDKTGYVDDVEYEVFSSVSVCYLLRYTCFGGD